MAAASPLPGANESELISECQRMARSLVISACDTPEALTRLQSIRESIYSKAQVATNRLRLMQTTQIDDMRWSHHLLEQSTNNVSLIQGSMSKIVQMCGQTHSLLQPAYNDIRRVGIARRHLRTITKLTDLFTSIPERARALEEQVTNDDAALKRVYVQVRQLVNLRDKAIKETTKYQNDPRSGDKVLHHFDSLSVVISALERRIWSNIADTFDLAEGDPGTLIKTLEVIEMEDYEVEKGFNRNLFPSPTKSSMMTRCLNILEESIGNRFSAEFKDDVPDKTLRMNSILEVGRKLIDDLYFVQNYVADCFPEKYKIFSFYESRYQKWLYSRLLLCITDLNKMATGDILNCIRWIQDYNDSMTALGVDTTSETSAAAMLNEHIPTLIETYMSVVSKTLAEWVQKIMFSDWKSEPAQDSSGHWTTTAPQDLFVILNQQLDLAIKRELKGEAFFNVSLMCFDVLKEFQSLQIQSLQSQGMTITDTFLIAVINNCQQCSENTEQMKDRCVDYLQAEIEGTDLEEKLNDKVEEILTGFAQVSTVAVKVVAEQVVKCLKDKVFPEIFSPVWFSARDGEFGEKITVTFADYFSDYEAWIADEFFFSKLIQESMQLFVRAYCDLLIASNMSVKKKDFLEKLHADYDVIREWYIGETISAYVPTKVAETLMNHFEKVTGALDTEESWIPLCFESIYTVYGPDRGVALKALLGMRSDLSSSQINQLCDKYKEKYASGAQPANENNVLEQKRSGFWGFNKA